MKNEQPSLPRKILLQIRDFYGTHPILSIFIGAVVVVLVMEVFVSPTNSASNAAIQTPTVSNQPTGTTNSATPTTLVVPATATASPNPSLTTPISLSQAFDEYSENIASNVDVTGTVSQLVPIQSGDSISESFGNTVMIQDGSYLAAVHKVSDSDFQNLVVGDKVEVKGGYMQAPSNLDGGSVANNVQIQNVGSVTVLSTRTSASTPKATSASYTPVSVSLYADNPTAYLGTTIAVSGMEKSFLPSGGPGISNFIEVTDLADPSQPLIAAGIDDAGSYTAVVNGLEGKYYPIIRIEGTGVASESFTETNGASVTVPVISVDHVDVCTDGNNSVSVACSAWTRLF